MVINDPVFSQYIPIIADIINRLQYLDFDTTQLNTQTSLKNDIGLDSLDFVEFIIEVEKEYNIVIHDSEADSLSWDDAKIMDVINLIKRYQK